MRQDSDKGGQDERTRYAGQDQGVNKLVVVINKMGRSTVNVSVKVDDTEPSGYMLTSRSVGSGEIQRVHNQAGCVLEG